MTLLHSPADIIRWLAVQAGLGADPRPDPTLVTWPVFAMDYPDKPDECLYFEDTASVPNGSDQFGEEDYHYGVQLVVRSNSDLLGYRKAEAVRKYLAEQVKNVYVHAYEEVGTATTTYLVQCLSGLGAVLPLGRDAPNTRRRLFTVNMMAVVSSVPLWEIRTWLHRQPP